MQLERDEQKGAPSLYANAAIFLMFFGAALLGAIRALNWTTAMFWMVICLLFLLMSRRPRGAP
jgi:hypothetical protein